LGKNLYSLIGKYIEIENKEGKIKEEA